MITSLDSLIAVSALCMAFMLLSRGHYYRDSARFMFFIAMAALFGGTAAYLEVPEHDFALFITSLNAHLPFYITPFHAQMIIDRLNFMRVICIGLAEFFFMFVFVGALIHHQYVFIKTWLKIALVCYFFFILLSPQFFFVVAFHFLTHTVMIAFSIFVYRRWRIQQILYLAIIAVFNLSLGVMQQLMANGAIPVGPLNPYDWYHLGVWLFVIMLYLLFTKGKLIERLNQV